MKKKILFLVNVDTFFVSHRLPIAKQLLKDGFEVHVGTQFKSYRKKLNHLGIKVHEINFNRNSLNPIANLCCNSNLFFNFENKTTNLAFNFDKTNYLWWAIILHNTC